MPFDVLGQSVVPIRLEHGPFPVLGFRVGSLAYCTDVSRVPEASRPLLEGLDVLVLDALRYEPHPTHLSLSEALALVESLKPEQHVLDPSFAQLRSRADTGCTPAAGRAGLRWASSGILNRSRGRSGCLPSCSLFRGVWHEMSPDPVLLERLERHGQAHLLRWWGELDALLAARLAAEIAAIDFDRLDRLIAELVLGNSGGGPAPERGPARSTSCAFPRPTASAWSGFGPAGIGADALAAGEVGVILVAGGSGTRLGFEGPKGTFPDRPSLLR